MQRLLDAVLPPRCPGCGQQDVVICPNCRGALARRLNEPPGTPIGLAARMPAGIVQLEWCCSYTGPARSCLHALKYDGERRLVEPLGELMAQRWRRAAVGGELIVPVPAHAARRRQRGFDQADLLARATGRQLGLPVVAALRRAASTTAQHRLGRRARAGNVASAFELNDGQAAAVHGRWVVLIDDVVTTGATLAGCARALRDAGASAVSALTLAHER